MVINDTFLRLQNEILLMQGFKTATLGAADNGGLFLIREAFPGKVFPLGVIHEFVYDSIEEKSASSGFVCGIASSIMKGGGAGAWIGAKGTVFPHAVNGFGIGPEKLFFIEPSTDKEKLWAIEEALKCTGLAVVMADIGNLGVTESRRFQLAVEKSGVTGFLLRNNTKIASSAVTRWQIKPRRADAKKDLPGIGFPQWEVALLKVKNGKPGNWQMEWRAGSFRHISTAAIEPIKLPLQKVV